MKKMVLKVKKGSPVAIRKPNGQAVNKIRLELSWTPDGIKAPYDMDAIIFGLNAQGKVHTQQDICYWGQPLTSYAESVNGDNRNGVSKDGEPDEVYAVDLTKVPQEIVRIPLVINIDEAIARNQNMLDLKNAKIDLFDAETNELLITADHDSAKVTDTSVLFAVLFRQADGSFTFTLVNQGESRELINWFDEFGVIYE